MNAGKRALEKVSRKNKQRVSTWFTTILNLNAVGKRPVLREEKKEGTTEKTATERNQTKIFL